MQGRVLARRAQCARVRHSDPSTSGSRADRGGPSAPSPSASARRYETEADGDGADGARRQPRRNCLSAAARVGLRHAIDPRHGRATWSRREPYNFRAQQADTPNARRRALEREFDASGRVSASGTATSVLGEPSSAAGWLWPRSIRLCRRSPKTAGIRSQVAVSGFDRLWFQTPACGVALDPALGERATPRVRRSRLDRCARRSPLVRCAPPVKDRSPGQQA